MILEKWFVLSFVVRCPSGQEQMEVCMKFDSGGKEERERDGFIGWL